MVISFRSGVLLFPRKQEVDITSVCQTGNVFPVFLLWFVRNRRRDETDLNEQLIPDFDNLLEENYDYFID